jgi:hypothetical protein
LANHKWQIANSKQALADLLFASYDLLFIPSSYQRSGHRFVYPAEAVFVVFIALQEVEAASTLADGVFDQARQQHPARAEL